YTLLLCCLISEPVLDYRLALGPLSALFDNTRPPAHTSFDSHTPVQFCATCERCLFYRLALPIALAIFGNSRSNRCTAPAVHTPPRCCLTSRQSPVCLPVLPRSSALFENTRPLVDNGLAGNEHALWHLMSYSSLLYPSLLHLSATPFRTFPTRPHS